MLIDVNSGKEITETWHPDRFKLIQKRLSPGDFSGVMDEINKRIDEAGGEIATAGWLPGSDWSDTPFQCIGLAAKMFGLMVQHTIMQRPERWGSGKYKIDGREIGSQTYFRLGD